jgi:hypothetical protein
MNHVSWRLRGKSQEEQDKRMDETGGRVMGKGKEGMRKVMKGKITGRLFYSAYQTESEMYLIKLHFA